MSHVLHHTRTIPITLPRNAPPHTWGKAYRQQHLEMYRKSARDYYNRNRLLCRLKDVLRRANGQGAVPRALTIEKYMLMKNCAGEWVSSLTAGARSLPSTVRVAGA